MIILINIYAWFVWNESHFLKIKSWSYQFDDRVIELMIELPPFKWIIDSY